MRLSMLTKSSSLYRTVYSERSSTGCTHRSGSSTPKNDLDHFGSLEFRAAAISGCSGGASSPAPRRSMKFMYASRPADCGNRFTVPSFCGISSISSLASRSRRFIQPLSPILAPLERCADVEAAECLAQERQAATLLHEGAWVVLVGEDAPDIFGGLAVAFGLASSRVLVDDVLEGHVAISCELPATLRTHEPRSLVAALLLQLIQPASYAPHGPLLAELSRCRSSSSRRSISSRCS